MKKYDGIRFMSFEELFEEDPRLKELMDDVEREARAKQQEGQSQTTIQTSPLVGNDNQQADSSRGHSETPKITPYADMSRYTTLGTAIGPLLSNPNNPNKRRYLNDLATRSLGEYMKTLRDTRDGNLKSYVPNGRVDEFREKLAELLGRKSPPRYGR